VLLMMLMQVLLLPLLLLLLPPLLLLLMLLMQVLLVMLMQVLLMMLMLVVVGHGHRAWIAGLQAAAVAALPVLYSLNVLAVLYMPLQDHCCYCRSQYCCCSRHIQEIPQLLL
jgi:hypothetical protein